MQVVRLLSLVARDRDGPHPDHPEARGVLWETTSRGQAEGDKDRGSGRKKASIIRKKHIMRAFIYCMLFLLTVMQV